jgi:hypothetical protein
MQTMAPIQPYLGSYLYKPCYWFNMSPGRHPIFAEDGADTVVLHCGGTGSNMANYFLNPCTNRDDPLGTLCADGKYRRQVSIHFAWDDKLKDFVQMLPLTRSAWQVGDAKYKGRRVQDHSIGIEGPGPATRDRSKLEREKWFTLLLTLKFNDPTLSLLITHARLSKDRQDPGQNLDWELYTSIPYHVEH